MKLQARYVEKPWGLTKLPAMFAPAKRERIGEVWFIGEPDLPLLPKYLFTSEALSVQVHPDDDQARARGLGRGKSECWYILDAEPDARIGLGLVKEVSESRLREAALDGTIDSLVEWRPVSAGDFFYVEPGTIHAIGSGLSLLEFQQNSDVTFRLYDYGRPRELHLDDALAVAHRRPYPDELSRRVDQDEECILVDGPHFTLVHARSDSLCDRRRWILPLKGCASCRSAVAAPGECLLLDPGDRLQSSGGRMLIGAAC